MVRGCNLTSPGSCLVSRRVRKCRRLRLVRPSGPPLPCRLCHLSDRVAGWAFIALDALRTGRSLLAFWSLGTGLALLAFWSGYSGRTGRPLITLRALRPGGTLLAFG